MSKWNKVYDDEQRRAIEYAYVELRVRPLRLICDRASRGELIPRNGAEPVPSFTIPESSAKSIALAAERRLGGIKLAPEVEALTARDRAETLQRRLFALADHELLRLEEKATSTRGRQPLDVEQARKIARLCRELATLPDPHDRRLPRTPGERDGSAEAPESPTRDSLAGSVLAAADASRAPSLQARINVAREPAPGDASPLERGDGETGDARITDATTTGDHDHAHHDHGDTDGEPCQYVGGAGAALAADAVLMAAARP